MIKLRPVELADINSLYAISLATGDAGGDASPLYRDGRMVGHIYSAPYAHFCAESSFVAEDGLDVLGYIVGALNTRAYEEQLERVWWPQLRQDYPEPSGERSTWDADQQRSFMIHHPRRTPEAITDAFPAHIHMNLMPRTQGLGVGTALLDLWLSTARMANAKAVHLGASVANQAAVRFWQSRGFTPLELPPTIPSGTTVWLGRSI
jgi:ribosomal protein S18 acetylase RimI-like enzyme